MKRIIAWVLVLVMVCLAGSAAAVTRKEYYEDVQNDTKGILKKLVEIYDKSPEIFDKDYIFMTFMYTKEMYVLGELIASETYSDAMDYYRAVGKEEEKNSEEMQQLIKIQSVMGKFIETQLNEKFYEWATGELSDGEAAAYIIELARTQTKSTDKLE